MCAIYYLHQTQLSLSDCSACMAREMNGLCLTRKADIRGRASVFQYASVYTRREPLQEKHFLKSRLGPLHRYGVEHLFMVIQNTRSISSAFPV